MREHLTTDALTPTDDAIKVGSPVTKINLEPANEIRKSSRRSGLLEPLKLKIIVEQQRAMKTFITGNNILDDFSQSEGVKGNHLGALVDRFNKNLPNILELENGKINDLENGSTEKPVLCHNGIFENGKKENILKNGVESFETDRLSDDDTSEKFYRQDGFLEFFRHFREQEILKELDLLRKHLLYGVYVFPSLESLQVWYGVIFVRNGPYSEGIFHFNLILNDDFPYSRPTVRLYESIFHPQFYKNGILNMDEKFPIWEHGKNHIWQILHYLYSNFVKIEVKNAVNLDAADQLKNETEKFEARARNSVLDSLLVYEEQYFKSKQTSDSLGNPFHCRILHPEELKQVKSFLATGFRSVGVSNGGLVGWAKNRLNRFLQSGLQSETEDHAYDVVDF